MTKTNPLEYKYLRRKLDIAELNFKTTDQIKSLKTFFGQKRALDALNFGIDIKSKGYNIYAMGPSGYGKHSLVSSILTEHANKAPIPDDWCYIYNFDTPEKPIALHLPAGLGSVFKQDMNSFIDDITANVITVFESNEYRLGMKKISHYFNKQRKIMLKHINGKPDKTTQLYKKQHEREKKFQLMLVKDKITPLLNKIKKKYNKFRAIVNYLNAVKIDILKNVNDFIKQNEKTNLLTFSLEIPAITKYKVNLLVDNSHLKGAPVIFENDPSYSTLICKIEHINQQGSITTNFSLIKAGSLHHANGGYLLIEARKLKKNPEAWEALKNALFAQKIAIKSIEHDSDSAKPISLEPMSIPLDIKIILLGNRNTYYSLCLRDPDFTELFKVPADFDEQIQRNKKNINLYARLIATIVKKKSLRPFHVSAVAFIIDYSSRLAEDIEKLSTHIRIIEDLILESDYWASRNNKKMVKDIDVKNAIQAQIHRMDRTRELYYEDIYRDFIIINTKDKLIGQVNCLSVRKVGDFAYGHPTRVSARIRLGKGKIIDIQREIKMAGPIHSKSSLIISNFLASRFNQDQLFSLSASISFEQVYVWTDGDSASVGELCALLSALSDVPIFQYLSVTGSIDQYGEVQAIGGVNEKIEGFFDVCKTRGLDGKQGVLIPAINIKNLMLREDVVQAAKEKKFFIYPITTIDEAISLLTGWKAASLYHKIEARLRKYTKHRLKK